MDTTASTIQYDDFAKLELRVATVLECKPHSNADKLLVLQIDLGGEKRQICAGLRQHTTPEELVGLPPHSFYRGIAAREADGSLQRLASFEGPRSRIPGGRDVAFRIVRPAAPGP